jgi:hypothetical protein
MDVVELIARYPRLYHMAEDGSWPDIKAHGLLSTKALLDRFEVTPGKREALYSRHRPESVVISHAERGRAVIRDQKSMDDRGLERALGDDLTPREWYELLNDRVFFWLTEERLTRLLGARAYRNRTHVVLTLDAATLIPANADRITLSPINSGCTKPMPQPRGRDTFQRIAQYPFAHMVAKRGARNDPVVELAVDYAVPDIAHHVIRVDRRQSAMVIEQVYERVQRE